MKFRDGLSGILGRLMIIGFTGQILLGFVWVCANFTSVQLFGETAFQVKVSGSLALDDYTGILYPAILGPVRVLFARGPLLWYEVMYLLQLALGFAAGFQLLRSLRFRGGDRKWCVWGSLVLLTFPMVMQCHLAILPESVSASLLMLECAYAVKLLRPLGEVPKGELSAVRSAGYVAQVSFFWMLAALNEYEMLYLGAVPVLVVLLGTVRRVHPKRKWELAYPILVCVLTACLVIGVGNLTQEKGLYERPERSWQKAVFDRTAWSAILRDSWRWPDSLKSTVGEETLLDTSLSPDCVKEVLEPALENAIGTNAARSLYLEMTRYAWFVDKGVIARHVILDLAANTMPPAVTILLLEGKGGPSFAARNYDVMKRVTPLFTGIYLDYGLWWWSLCLLITWILSLLRIGGNRLPKKEGRAVIPVSTAVMFFLLAGCMICRETMQGDGLQDYKQVIFVTILWMLRMLLELPENPLRTENS